MDILLIQVVLTFFGSGLRKHERKRETEDVPGVLPEQLQRSDSLTTMVNTVEGREELGLNLGLRNLLCLC